VGRHARQWARAGSEIVTVCLTRGEAARQATPADMTRERLAKIREESSVRVPRARHRGGRLPRYQDGVLVPSIACGATSRGWCAATARTPW